MTENKSANINIILALTASIVALIVFFAPKDPGYFWMFLMPITYVVMFVMIYRQRVASEKPIFFMVLLVVCFFRYVVLPLLLTSTGSYGGRSSVPPSADSFNASIFLICYEGLAIAIAINMWERHRHGNWNRYSRSRNVRLTQKVYTSLPFFYVLSLLALSSLLLYVSPVARSLVNFVEPVSISFRDVFSYSMTDNLISNFFIISKQIFFVSLLVWVARKYEKSRSGMLLFVVLGLVLLNSVIYVGKSRVDILICAIASLLIATHLFGSRMKAVAVFVLFFVSVLIVYVTSAREVVTTSASALVNFTDIVQVYTGGIYNVAIGLETKEWFPEAGSISVLFFDIFRPMVGVNYLIKDLDILYSNIYFNERMWVYIDRRSQIIPMVAQGNLFFGYVLAPVLSVLFVSLYYFLETIIKTTRYIEVRYFLLLVTMRLGFMVGQNTMNIVNDISVNLFLFLVLMSFGKFLSRLSRR